MLNDLTSGEKVSALRINEEGTFPALPSHHFPVATVTGGNDTFGGADVYFYDLPI